MAMESRLNLTHITNNYDYTYIKGSQSNYITSNHMALNFWGILIFMDFMVVKITFNKTLILKNYGMDTVVQIHRSMGVGRYKFHMGRYIITLIYINMNI